MQGYGWLCTILVNFGIYFTEMQTTENAEKNKLQSLMFSWAAWLMGTNSTKEQLHYSFGDSLIPSSFFCSFSAL